jgi:hypothetical protein
MRAVAIPTFALCLSLVSCGGSKPQASVLADDGTPPANANDIQRYPDEIPLNERQYIEWKAAPVRDAHPDGRLVAILTRGNPVAKAARRGEFFLITFPNPDDPSKRWSGWVNRKVFEPGTETYPPLGNPQKCTNDAECSAIANAKCTGVASLGPGGLDGYRFCAGSSGSSAR